MRHGLVKIAVANISNCQIVMGPCIAGIDLDNRQIMLDGLRGLPQPAQGYGQIEMGIGRIRSEAQGLPVMGDSLLGASLIQQQIAKLYVGTGKIGLDAQGF